MEHIPSAEHTSLTAPIENDLITVIAHELRTPLTSIIGFTEAMLHESELTEEQRREYLKIIRKEGHRLADLITNLVVYLRIVSRRT